MMFRHPSVVNLRQDPLRTLGCQSEESAHCARTHSCHNLSATTAAQIFYVVDEHMPDDADVISEPFACDSDASSSTLPGEQEDLEFRPDDRDTWKSCAKSTADSIDKPVDFLQVKIPSSVMTPVSQPRNTLWARK
ncbi:hypothetical protein A0H81_04530 [Grifola frondosa]|uniref:Uncharacterized protein n=1 Tax=Grifola frondosa TaxID=5627 RepID=A0A1C7MEX2_GRIFR|nr:hypothetical protein A0H81_04530 [Grifola frondosa]